MRGNRRGKAVLAFLMLAVLAVVGYIVGRHFEEPAEEPRSVMTEGFGRYEEKIYKNSTYYRKTGITTLLLMGIDRDTEETQSMYRNGGQSDFLMLLVIDHEAGTLRRLQIERDTVARIHVLTVLGQDGGYRNLQICLSHGYGTNQEECAQNTLEAVSHYLDGLQIDLFMAVDYETIGPVNDLLGGVTVTLADDFTDLDPAMARGTTLTLRGKQAEWFVRSRMTIGDGTNASRQVRQREWLEKATALLEEKVRADSGFLNTLMDSMGSRLVTNASQGRIVNEFNRAVGYTRPPVEQIPGTYGMSSAGFVEYHTDPDEVTRWVLDAFYRPAEQTDSNRDSAQEDA